jgi:hypothetical protein
MKEAHPSRPISFDECGQSLLMGGLSVETLVILSLVEARYGFDISRRLFETCRITSNAAGLSSSP